MFKNTLDRLAIASLNFKYRAKFKYLHHPLCQRFQGHSFSIAGLHFCVSCALLYTGALSTLLLLYLFGPNSILNLSFAVITVAVLTLSHPKKYSLLPRKVCLLLRFGLGASIGWTLSLMITSQWPIGAMSLFFLYVSHRSYKRTRATLKKHSCEGCSELSTEGHCSGYKQQAEQQQKLEIAIEDVIIRSSTRNIV